MWGCLIEIKVLQAVSVGTIKIQRKDPLQYNFLLGNGFMSWSPNLVTDFYEWDIKKILKLTGDLGKIRRVSWTVESEIPNC